MGIRHVHYFKINFDTTTMKLKFEGSIPSPSTQFIYVLYLGMWPRCRTLGGIASIISCQKYVKYIIHVYFFKIIKKLMKLKSWFVNTGCPLKTVTIHRNDCDTVDINCHAWRDVFPFRISTLWEAITSFHLTLALCLLTFVL